MTRHSVAVIGAGKLGELVLSGLLRAGWPPQQVLATTRRAERADELAGRYGIRPVRNLTAVTQADVLLIAVKPQDAGRLLD
jgi:pyrroline-5-carboxylate reductase